MIKQFKNNNLHIKFDSYDEGIGVVEKLYLNYDLCPICDEYCISNFAMASDWSYNGGYNFYTITSYDFDDLESGKTVILKPLSKKYMEENYKGSDYYGEE